MLALACVLLLAAGGWFVDHRRRVAEFDTLAGCVQRGEAAAVDARARVSFMANYVRPALSSVPTEQAREGLLQLVAGVAAERVPRLEAARAGCAPIGMPPWHDELNAADAAYRASLDGQLDRMRAIAADGAEAFVQQDGLVELKGRAATALVAAAPTAAAAARARSLLPLAP